MRSQTEISTEVSYERLSRLRDTGFRRVRPGIDNLSTQVLRLAGSRAEGCGNVRMLRDARTAELSVEWTYRYGFPGEQDRSYARALAQFPALHHLPPMQGAVRCGDGISGTTEAALLAGVAAWQRDHPLGRLELVEDGSTLVVLDDRPGFGRHEYVFAGEAAELLRYLDAPCPLPVLAARFGGQVHSRLADLRACGLVFTDAGSWVHVLPRQAPAYRDLRDPPRSRPSDGGGAAMFRPSP
ncbi:hypothetical protein [Saccharopolyspora dendranthemae]|uniref:Uncharacterized protein n=1 Tax=Saccharopolyspora dendranthemae TaxID=1181886 RepID=A0A561U9R3_9PSEU|nr:hypothetical protein [Saccharopolyspora dendranthemae]TWF96111.1 hypothetical protein FHU35_121112 [Saccharopolyspora dendranthemae]